MTIKYSISILALLVALGSCKKKSSSDEPQPTISTPVVVTTTKYGKAVLHLHIFVGDTELEAFDDDSPEGDRRISLSKGSVHMYNFELVDLSNNIVKMSDTTLEKTPDNVSYYISKVPVGKYKTLRFKVGYPTADSSSPIVNFKGKLDTAATPDQNNTRVDFEYTLTTRTRDIQVVLPGPTGTQFNITETGSEVFHLYIDLNELFGGLNLSDPQNLKVVSTEENKSTVAEKLASNIANMFKYEGE